MKVRSFGIIGLAGNSDFARQLLATIAMSYQTIDGVPYATHMISYCPLRSL
jgi:hypothetical protein